MKSFTEFPPIARRQIPLARGPKDASRKDAYAALNKLIEQIDAPDHSARRESVVSRLGWFLT